MRKDFLDKVFNKATNTEVCTQYSGRYVDSIQYEEGQPLRIKFDDGCSITHETVIELSEDDYGYWIETTKKLWKFDYKEV